ncbi:MAG: type II secretion system protein [Vulcanimicrobiota bacterium]
MIIMKKNAKHSGYTLPEILVSIVVFMLLTTSLVSTVTLGLRFWLGTVARNNVRQNTITACSVIGSELRQAIINSDSTTGYSSITPAIKPSGVLYPNQNNTTLSYIYFTEPNYANFDPSDSIWDQLDAKNYSLIKFYVENNTLYREQITYNTGGSISSTAKNPVVQSTEGTLTLTATYSSPISFRISVYSKEGDKAGTVATQLYLPSQ